MEVFLIITTAVSTAAALGTGAILIRTLREERRRSDARVEALIALSDGQEALPSAPAPAVGRLSPAPAVSDAGYPDLDLNAPVAGVGSLFVEPESRSPWRNRMAAAAACLLVLAATVFVWPRSDGRERGSAGAQSGVNAPLELLSLDHAAQPDGLSISGIVQNPRGAMTRADVVATVFLLASDGSLVARSHAPLDFTQLRPGDESPFVVRVPAGTGVARYRVSFRDSRGGIIGHVDRRTGDQVARSDRR